MVPSDKKANQPDIILEWSSEFIFSDNFLNFLELIPEAVILSNEQGQVIASNRVAQHLFQYSETEFQNVIVEELVPSKIKDIHVSMREKFFADPRPRFLENRNLDLSATKKNGTEFPMESALFAIRTDQGTIAVNLLRDVTEQKEVQKNLEEYAFIDALTGLPNRRYFYSNLKVNIDRCLRHQHQLALLFIDLDHFKPINDLQGHEVGDVVLREISKKLVNCLRGEDFIARLGGDEFIVMLYPAKNYDAVKNTAERLLEACREPIEAEQDTFTISASIGITLSNTEGHDEQQLVNLADEAMYKAKSCGGNCIAYSEEDA